MLFTAVSNSEFDMTIRDASYQALETVLNQYLSLDPEISQQLGKLHGAVIGFDLTGTGITLYFVPDQNGLVQVFSQVEAKADCMIKGSPFTLLRSNNEDNAKQVFSGEVQIEGNSSLAQEFTRILKQVDVDWEEQLSRITGDIIAHQLGNTFRTTGEWLRRNNNSARLNLKEYLQEEARLLPGIFELENFYADVDQLRDDSERLSARITRLQNSRSNKR